MKRRRVLNNEVRGIKKTQLQIFADALDKLNIGYDEHTFPVGDGELLVVITTPQIIAG